MNVSNFANLFHQNAIFQQRPLSQRPLQQSITNALNRLSDDMQTAQDHAKDMKARFDTFELSAEAANRKDDSTLEEMPEGLLHFYLNVCKVGANLSQQQETSLMEYRDQLTAFDQTIQGYQDMLDGKAELPDQMNREDIAILLEATRTAREQFLQEGAAELNQMSNCGPSAGGFYGKAYNMLAGGSQDDFGWQIDASSGDIYGEIDRAIASAHKVTSGFEEGASSIRAELKRRGCLQAGEEEFSLDDQDTVGRETAERMSLFQAIYDDIWAAFRENIAENRE